MGVEVIELINEIRSENAKRKYLGLVGREFGNVRVIGFAETINKARRIMVQCRCGNEYPITARYLLKRHKTQCQRCSQILKHRGKVGYEQFLNNVDWVTKKTPDDQFRKMKHAL